jgi:hypothetical protein
MRENIKYLYSAASEGVGKIVHVGHVVDVGAADS